MTNSDFLVLSVNFKVIWGFRVIIQDTHECVAHEKVWNSIDRSNLSIIEVGCTERNCYINRTIIMIGYYTIIVFQQNIFIKLNPDKNNSIFSFWVNTHVHITYTDNDNRYFVKFNRVWILCLPDICIFRELNVPQFASKWNCELFRPRF